MTSLNLIEKKKVMMITAYASRLPAGFFSVGKKKADITLVSYPTYGYSCSRFPDDDAIYACGFEESTHARYIHLTRSLVHTVFVLLRVGFQKQLRNDLFDVHKTVLQYLVWPLT